MKKRTQDRTAKERFWARVQKSEEGCWNWEGYKTLLVNKKPMLASKYSYQLHHKTRVPSNKFMHHACYNTKCVNPKHLFISDWKENPIKYHCDPNAFLNEDAISYYLLGAFMTDGCIRDPATSQPAAYLTSNDLDWLTMIRDLVCKEIPISKRNEKCGELRIGFQPIVNWLLKMGCTPRKTLTLKFPTVPQKYLPDFIRGCMDGDGSIGTYLAKQKPNYKYAAATKPAYRYAATLTGGSKKFFTTLKRLLKSIGLAFHFGEYMHPPHRMKNGKMFVQKHPYFVLTLAGKYASQFLDWVYYKGNPLSMPRKQLLAEKLTIMFHEYGYRGV